MCLLMALWSLLYCSSCWVHLLFASARHKVLKFPEPSCCPNSCISTRAVPFVWNILLPSPLLNLAKSRESFKLRSWAVSTRKLSCSGPDAGLSRPRSCNPTHTPSRTSPDRTRTGGFPVSPTTSTSRGDHVAASQLLRPRPGWVGGVVMHSRKSPFAHPVWPSSWGYPSILKTSPPRPLPPLNLKVARTTFPSLPLDLPSRYSISSNSFNIPELLYYLWRVLF